MPSFHLQDSHLHLQSPRLLADSDTILKQAREAGVSQFVINGTSPRDWDDVSALAQRHPSVITPSFGLHPWNTSGIDCAWKKLLIQKLEAHPQAGIGECGLDRWMKGLDANAQEEAFLFQLQLAHERNLPLSLHILKAWGWLINLLRDYPTPARGFLLHSYSGSRETAKRLIDSGAYFSFSGAFLLSNRTKTQEVFRQLPLDRILIETDAPDMLPPKQWISHPLPLETNHPANLKFILKGLSELLDLNEETLAKQLELNFQRFFTF